MKPHIYDRVVRHANYICSTKDTVRGTANKHKVGKSTVHLDLTERLKYVDMNLYKEVQEVLSYNKLTRNIRGGEATKKKHLGESLQVPIDVQEEDYEENRG